MKPHRFDLVNLLLGLAFVSIGAAFLAHELTDRNFDPAWVVAGVCMVLGAIALGATLLRTRDEPASAEPIEASDES